jgi:AraC-like DNA-binding protein
MSQPLLHYREQVPPADLAGWVEAFWFIHTLASSPGLTQHWVLPEANVNLVFWLPRGWQQSDLLFTPILSGPTLKAFRKPARPGEAYLGVRFRAGTGSAFVDCHSSDLHSVIQPLKNAQPRWADRLTDRMSSARSESVGLAILIDELRCLAASRPAVDIDMVEAAAWLRRQSELITIEEWSSTFNLSDRQFRRRFTEAIGLSPKAFSRIIRMQALVRGHLLQPRVDWAPLSYRAGYADQSHLVNEFRTLCGDRPTNYHRHLQVIDHALLLNESQEHGRNLQYSGARAR